MHIMVIDQSKVTSFTKGLYASLHHSTLYVYLQEVDAPDANGQTSLMLAAQKIIG